VRGAVCCCTRSMCCCCHAMKRFMAQCTRGKSSGS
jgi:hypothetical protein